MSSYRFCAENEGRLRRFLAAATSAPYDTGRTATTNKWSAHFARPHSPPPYLRDDTPALEISSDGTPSEETPADENFTETADEQCLCDFVESECKDGGRGIYEEVALKCGSNGKVLEYLVKNLSENACIKLSQSTCQSEATDQFLNLYFVHFLPLVIKTKEHTRLLDNLLLQNYRSFPSHFRSTFLPLFLNDDTSSDFFSNFVKVLNEEEKKIILNDIVNVKFLRSNFLSHIPSILLLYKSLSEYTYVEGSMVKLLCVYSEFGSKDNNYGKLLLALIQKMDSSSQNIGLVENLCYANETIFKKPCTNALNKLKNI